MWQHTIANNRSEVIHPNHEITRYNAMSSADPKIPDECYIIIPINQNDCDIYALRFRDLLSTISKNITSPNSKQPPPLYQDTRQGSWPQQRISYMFVMTNVVRVEVPHTRTHDIVEQDQNMNTTLSSIFDLAAAFFFLGLTNLVSLILQFQRKQVVGLERRGSRLCLNGTCQWTWGHPSWTKHCNTKPNIGAKN